ncbi:hypothetical protein COB57_05745, partial [Candidatus Peregrinibacteria bacterium]
MTVNTTGSAEILKGKIEIPKIVFDTKQKFSIKNLLTGDLYPKKIEAFFPDFCKKSIEEANDLWSLIESIDLKESISDTERSEAKKKAYALYSSRKKYSSEIEDPDSLDGDTLLIRYDEYVAEISGVIKKYKEAFQQEMIEKEDRIKGFINDNEYFSNSLSEKSNETKKTIWKEWKEWNKNHEKNFDSLIASIKNNPQEVSPDHELFSSERIKNDKTYKKIESIDDYLNESSAHGEGFEAIRTKYESCPGQSMPPEERQRFEQDPLAFIDSVASSQSENQENREQNTEIAPERDDKNNKEHLLGEVNTMQSAVEVLDKILTEDAKAFDSNQLKDFIRTFSSLSPKGKDLKKRVEKKMEEISSQNLGVAEEEAAIAPLYAELKELNTEVLSFDKMVRKSINLQSQTTGLVIEWVTLPDLWGMIKQTWENRNDRDDLDTKGNIISIRKKILKGLSHISATFDNPFETADREYSAWVGEYIKFFNYERKKTNELYSEFRKYKITGEKNEVFRFYALISAMAEKGILDLQSPHLLTILSKLTGMPLIKTAKHDEGILRDSLQEILSIFGEDAYSNLKDSMTSKFTSEADKHKQYAMDYLPQHEEVLSGFSKDYMESFGENLDDYGRLDINRFEAEPEKFGKKNIHPHQVFALLKAMAENEDNKEK